MSRVRSFVRYQLWDFRKAVLIYYAAIIAIALFMIAGRGDSTGQSGLSGSTIVFVFVIGLNCFRTSFLFSQANNMSRRTFFLATIASLLGLAVLMSLVDFVIDSVMNKFPFYQGFFDQIYLAPGLAKILWTILLLTFVSSLGWMVTMLYYRANTLVKVLISVSPIVIITILGYLHQRTAGRLGYWIVSLFGKALGLSVETSTPYPAMLSFALASVLVWAINYLLMFKTPVRPY